MNKLSQNLFWENTPDAEERLQELRTRDLEVAKIAHGLQMRTRITDLENEIAILRTIEKDWKLRRLSKLYFTAPRILRALLRRIKGSR